LKTSHVLVTSGSNQSLRDFLFTPKPTTGLDARSAMLVVKLLRRIADQGRTVCATIHQPSSTVFEMFVSLDMTVPLRFHAYLLNLINCATWFRRMNCCYCRKEDGACTMVNLDLSPEF
jgi:hypothetical protein